MIESSPELARLSERVRGQLFDDARTAALTSANARLDALSELLQERSQGMREHSGK